MPYAQQLVPAVTAIVQKPDPETHERSMVIGHLGELYEALVCGLGEQDCENEYD